MVFPQLNKTVVEGKRINLPKLGWIKVRLSRPIPDGFVVKQAQIIRKARGDFVVLCIQSDVELPEPTLSGYPVGMDLELQSFLVTSENYHVKVPKFFKQRFLSSSNKRMASLNCCNVSSSLRRKVLGVGTELSSVSLNYTLM